MRPESSLAAVATFVVALLLGAHWMIAFAICAVVLFVVDAQMDTHSQEELRKDDLERRLAKIRKKREAAEAKAA